VTGACPPFDAGPGIEDRRRGGRSPGLRVTDPTTAFPEGTVLIDSRQAWVARDASSGMLVGDLAAHSCGHSRGFSPRSLFAAWLTKPGRHHRDLVITRGRERGKGGDAP